MKTETEERFFRYLLGLVPEQDAAKSPPAILNIQRPATSAATLSMPAPSAWTPAAEDTLSSKPNDKKNKKNPRPAKFYKGMLIDEEGFVEAYFLKRIINRTGAFPVYGLKKAAGEGEVDMVTPEEARHYAIAFLSQCNLSSQQRQKFETHLKGAHKNSIGILCGEIWRGHGLVFSRQDNIALMRVAGGHDNALSHYEQMGLFLPGSLPAALQQEREVHVVNFMNLAAVFQANVMESGEAALPFDAFKLAHYHVGYAHKKTGVGGDTPDRTAAAFAHRAWVDGVAEWALGVSLIKPSEREAYKLALHELRMAALLKHAGIDAKMLAPEEIKEIDDFLQLQADHMNALEELRFMPFVEKHKPLENRAELFGEEVDRIRASGIPEKWNGLLTEQRGVGFTGLADVDATRKFLATHDCGSNEIKKKIVARLGKALDTLVPVGAKLAAAPAKPNAAEKPFKPGEARP